MFNDLLILTIGFELILLLNCGLRLSQLCPIVRIDATRLILKTSLPLTLVLLSGTVLLIAAVGSTSLTEIHNYLDSISTTAGAGRNHSIPALGVLLILMGCVFRMGAIPIHFRLKDQQAESPCWIFIMTTLIPLLAGLSFLILFASQIGVIHSAELEQIFYYSSLIILTVSSGLLLVENQLRGIFGLLIIQITGVFVALLSAVCWRWRHETGNPESGSIQQTILEYAPELLFSCLTVAGLAFLVDGLTQLRIKIRTPDQLRGIFADQRLTGIGAAVLLLTLAGFPGLTVFRLKWQTLLLLLEIHQPSMTGTMATLHAGYLGLAIVVAVSSALTAFVCLRLLILICFAQPMMRYRQTPHRGMLIACYCCVIGTIVFSLKMMINFQVG
ncbi:proton-conducting transporter transmembrane domain-containing protein [Gimesia panareensis]|uniref:proton-conducting transporter transmembrane domain-containing protein n=1 Tax=Gimesia panareensis TaxID=2527978 RepID=UPI00118CDE50|nr:proton-conducting transporter membrane subunit [Gimesia panareensis]QDU53445.1 NADH:ubiquinone oxidoreductase subunit N [Gimesia panareensis]